MKKKFAVIILLLIITTGISFSQTIKTKGLITGWLAGNAQKAVQPVLGFRYIPNFSIEQPVDEGYTLDAEFSLNIYGNLIKSSSASSSTCSPAGTPDGR